MKKFIPDDAKRLKILRKDENLTQIELAELIGKTQGSIQKYENGDLYISTEVFKVLHEKLNYSYDWLISGEGKKKVVSEKKSTLHDIKDITQKYDLLNQRYEDLNRKMIKIYRDFYSNKQDNS